VRTLLALTATAALLLTGCGSQSDDVRAAAQRWSSAVGAEDWALACDLLAPSTREELESSAQKPCEQALPEEATAPPDAEPEIAAYGSSAQARWSGETVFLSQFGSRWLVWAAGCTPTGHDRPYDCDLAGG